MKKGARATKTTAERVHDELLRWFASHGLSLDEVWNPMTDDLEHQNRQLEQLQCWVLAYRAQPDRHELERHGFIYPPVSPGFGPDQDWFRFERWVAGLPMSWRYVDLFGPLAEPETLTDAETAAALEEIEANLASRQVRLALHEGVPPSLVYTHLKQLLEEDAFEVLPPDTATWLDGCTGYCPDCFQRPWCDVGMEPDWEEDGWPDPIATPESMQQWLDRITADLRRPERREAP